MEGEKETGKMKWEEKWVRTRKQMVMGERQKERGGIIRERKGEKRKGGER